MLWLMAVWQIVKTIGESIIGWLFADWRRALVAALLILLIWTHWEAYTSGKESEDTKFAKQQEAALAKAAADADRINALQDKLTSASKKRDDEVTSNSGKKIEEIEQSVKANPSAPNCVVPSDELRMLNELIHQANEAGPR